MTNISTNNRHIAKNTLLLYFRMLLIMLVSFYTSRIVLKALGVEDYGIYTIVGDTVAMFTILSNSLSSAISRFITFELGRQDIDNLKKIFSVAILIQIFLIIIILLLAETVGLWFLNNKIIIPQERLQVANWVYQFSILTFCINLISVPYNATIIAHEKMSVFAYISIFEAFGRLFIAILITKSPTDKLFLYSCLLTIISIITRFLYRSYCKKHFKECSFQFTTDRTIIKEMFSFAGWNFIGAGSAVLRDQGGSIIINLFGGSAVNAARGLALQVSNAIQGFTTNFMTALNPQIIKSHASGNHGYMMNLIFQGARFSFYLLLLLSLPIILNTEYILSKWLDYVPAHTISFVQLSLIFTLSESLAHPLVTAMLATGNIRNYQLVVGGLQILNIPISYLFLRIGYAPEIIYVVAIAISVCCEMARLYMLKKMISLPIRQFLTKVYFNVIIVSFIAASASYLLGEYYEPHWYNVILNCILCITISIITILHVGCTSKERTLIKNKLCELKNKFVKKS